MSNWSYLVFKFQQKPELKQRKTRLSQTFERLGSFYVTTSCLFGTQPSPDWVKEIAEQLFHEAYPPALSPNDGLDYSFLWDKVSKTYNMETRPPLTFDTIRVKIKPTYRSYASLILPEFFAVEEEYLIWNGNGEIGHDFAEEIRYKLYPDDWVSSLVPEVLTLDSDRFDFLLDGRNIMPNLRQELAFIHDGITILDEGKHVLHYPSENGSDGPSYWVNFDRPLSDKVEIYYDLPRFFGKSKI